MPAILAGRDSIRVSALRLVRPAASSSLDTRIRQRSRSRSWVDRILSFNGAGEHGDAFVTSVKPIPSSASVIDNLDFSGFIGGDGEDAAFWVAVDGAGDVFVVGDTTSGPFTFPDGDGIFGLPSFGSDSGGSLDAFLVKLAVGS